MVQMHVVFKKIRKCTRNDFKSFPASCFWSRGFVLYSIGSEISRFWYIKTLGKRTAIEIYFLCYSVLSVHCGDFIEQIKEKSVIYTLTGFETTRPSLLRLNCPSINVRDKEIFIFSSFFSFQQ